MILFLLSERQMARISPFVPLAHGVRLNRCSGRTDRSSDAASSVDWPRRIVAGNVMTVRRAAAVTCARPR